MYEIWERYYGTFPWNEVSFKEFLREQRSLFVEEHPGKRVDPEVLRKWINARHTDISIN